MLEVDNKNTRKRCEISLKLTTKTLERRQWHRSDVFIVNFEHISLCSSVFIVNFGHAIAGWENSENSLWRFFVSYNPLKFFPKGSI